MAEFGTQDTGVFDKDKLDKACNHEFYTYDKLTPMQLDRVEKLGIKPNEYIYPEGVRAPMNPFRTMGVDCVPVHYKPGELLGSESQSAAKLLFEVEGPETMSAWLSQEMMI